MQNFNDFLAPFQKPQIPSPLDTTTKIWHSFALLVLFGVIQQVNAHVIAHIDLLFGGIVVLALFVPQYLRWSLLLSLFYWLSLLLEVELQNHIVWFVSVCFYEAMVLCVLFVLKKHYLNVGNMRLKSLVVQMGLLLLSAFAQLPVSYLVFDNGLVTSELSLLMYLVKTQLFLYASVLYILCVTWLVKFVRRDDGPFMHIEWAKMSIQISIIAMLIVGLYQIQPNIEYLMRMVYFIPLVWFGYRFGWVGVFVAVLLLITALSIYLHTAPLTLVMEYQTFLVSYLLVALLLGGMFIEQYIIEEELYKAKHQVTISNQELQDKNNQLKVLASDIIAIQEGERKKLSQELHDEAAQNITALQVGIKLNEKKGSVTFQSHLSIIKNQAAEIYQKVYELVHWLRPRIVDEVGLVATLQSTYFADRLARANITYDAHIILDESALSIELKIAIFRLIQEATLLAMENRSVTKFCVHLSQHQDKIKLVISDDREQAYTSTNTPIFDPFKIEYQVLALAGSLSIELELGMRLQILLPMHTSADHLGEGA